MIWFLRFLLLFAFGMQIRRWFQYFLSQYWVNQWYFTLYDMKNTINLNNFVYKRSILLSQNVQHLKTTCFASYVLLVYLLIYIYIYIYIYVCVCVCVCDLVIIESCWRHGFPRFSFSLHPSLLSIALSMSSKLHSLRWEGSRRTVVVSRVLLPKFVQYYSQHSWALPI